MADYSNRKRENPCTTYKREGKTKQNVYECLPSGAVEYTAGCGGRSTGRTNQDVYECCPPTPVELRCSVCWTAERDSCNIWTRVPFVSYSALCGPTLGDLLVYLLHLMPLSFLGCLGIAHPRCCTVKPKPPLTKSSNPCARTPQSNAPRCQPVNRCCPPPNCTEKTRKVVGPCNPRKDRIGFEGGDAVGYTGDDRIAAWMRDEYEALARELAEIKRLTNDDAANVDSDRDLLQARNYVLDRLAEMLAKREEIEKRMERKKK